MTSERDIQQLNSLQLSLLESHYWPLHPRVTCSLRPRTPAPEKRSDQRKGGGGGPALLALTPHRNHTCVTSSHPGRSMDYEDKGVNAGPVGSPASASPVPIWQGSMEQ